MGNIWNCIKLDTEILEDGKKVCSIQNKEGTVTYIDNIAEEDIPNFIRDTEAKAKKQGKTANEYLDELAELKNRTKPSKSKNPFAKPKGIVTKMPKIADDATRISLELENEAAEILAKNGFDIEQNPFVSGVKNPDYRIEGKIFDCYSPYKDTNVRNIWSSIEKKIVEEQTKRIILNLKIWEGDILKLQKQFSDWAIEGLEEIIYITKEGKINHLKLTK